MTPLSDRIHSIRTMPNGTEAPGLHEISVKGLCNRLEAKDGIPDIAEVVGPDEDVNELGVVNVCRGR